MPDRSVDDYFIRAKGVKTYQGALPLHRMIPSLVQDHECIYQSADMSGGSSWTIN